MSQLSNVSGGPARIDAVTPTQAIVNDANRIETVVDANGRVLGVSKLGMSVRRKVLKALSADNGQKDRYFGIAATAACCVSINGVPVPFPTTELQLDALIDRLEEDGLSAVSEGIQRFNPPASDSEDDLKNS